MPDFDSPFSSAPIGSPLPGLVRLIAKAPDASAEIFVLDGRLNRIAEGIGRVEIDVSPGMYKIKFKAGTAIHEVHRAVRPDEAQVIVEVTAKLLRFDSAAPLVETANTHEYHQHNASRISGIVHQHLGSGSQLFLFVRDFTPSWPAVSLPNDNPATGLTLRNSSGSLLLNLAEAGERSREDSDKWAGVNIELNPGCYILRVDVGELGGFEQTVVTCRGWQTQVFLLRRPFDKQQIVYRADLPTASVLMTRVGQLNQPFEPWHPSLRLTELARQGLASGRGVVSDIVLRAAVVDETVRPEISEQALAEMLDRKFDNPMLGIFGAHLLLASPEKRDLLREVVGNLHRLIGDEHPDVTVLDLWLNESEKASQSFKTPPMLRSSWEIVLNASRERYDLVPLDSLSMRIASRVWGGGAWLVWRTVNEHRERPIRHRVESQEEPLPPLQEVARSLGLGPIASELLGLIMPRRLTFQISSRGMELLFPDRSGSRAILRDAELVRMLGVPRAVAGAALVELASKLDRRLDQVQSEAPYALPDPGTRSLFDGSITTFKKWRFVGEGAFALIDGALEAQPGNDFGILYYSAETFSDYRLRLQFRLSRRSNDSGIFVRFRDPLQPVPDRLNPSIRYPYQKKQWVAVHTGFEVQIDERARGDPPGLDEHRTGAIYNVPVVPDPMRQLYTRGPELAAGKWHDCEIEVIGNRYNVTINGTLTTQFQNFDLSRGLPPVVDPASGYIGIQSLIGNIRFRNIRLKPF